MVSVTFFECCVTQSDVSLYCLRCDDLCLVDNVPYIAISLEWARILVSAIADVFAFFGLIWRFAYLSFIVAGDDGFYVVHTAVAQLKSVPVEDFVQRIGFREVQIN